MKASHTHRARLFVALTAALAACGPRDGADTAAGAGGTGAAAGEVVAATPAPGTGDGAALGASGTDTRGAPTGAVATAPAVLGIVGVANANEIGSSRIAQEKATSSEVKAFAADMVRDHRAMQDDADALAKELGATPLPADRARQLKRDGDRMLARLQSTATGAEFDRTYVDGQVQAHLATLQELESLQGAATDEHVKSLIANAIPKVRAHLERARRIQLGLRS